MSGGASARSIRVDAEYRKGRRLIDLWITHSPTIAAVIGFGGPATSEYDRETADGYTRRRREGDDIVVEEWNKASKSGSYARLIGDQFYVKASGGDVTPEQLQEAVASFGGGTTGATSTRPVGFLDGSHCPSSPPQRPASPRGDDRSMSIPGC